MSGEHAGWPTVVALACYVTVAIIWVVPDTRIERAIAAM
jgi:hypothetical protein